MVLVDKEIADLSADNRKTLESFQNDHNLVPEMALRFLYARKFNRLRADELLANYQTAITQHGFDTITAQDVEAEMRTGKMYLPGTRDRNGAALFIINAAKHKPGEFVAEQTVKLAFYLGELATSNIRTQKSGITLVANMDGVEWTNFDSNFQKNVLDFFQQNIPARVKNILLFRAPWWINMMVKMVTPFLSEKLRDRIRCLDDDSELICYVEPDQLPADLGGKFNYDHSAFVKHELDRAGIKAFQKSKAAQQVMGSVLGANLSTILESQQPSSMLLVSQELQVKLHEERAKALEVISEKIKQRRESLRRHSIPLDLNKMILTRAARLSIDLGSVPSIQPNSLGRSASGSRRGSGTSRSARMVKASPIAEAPNEDYSQDALVKRIEASIRANYAQGDLAPIQSEESETNKINFTRPEPILETEKQSLKFFEQPLTAIAAETSVASPDKCENLHINPSVAETKRKNVSLELPICSSPSPSTAAYYPPDAENFQSKNSKPEFTISKKQEMPQISTLDGLIDTSRSSGARLKRSQGTAGRRNRRISGNQSSEVLNHLRESLLRLEGESLSIPPQKQQ